MKLNTTIQIKAAFLMIVFSLNTIIGFACAVGIDMRFNSDHHHHDDEIANETPANIHAGAKKHVHNNEATEHHGGDNYNHKSKDDGQDNCCNDQVMSFNHLDKYVAYPLSISNRIFFISFIYSFHNSENLFSSLATTGIKYFVRSCHPSIPDIRIAIKSFQI